MSCGPQPVTFRLLDEDASWTLDLVPEIRPPEVLPRVSIGRVIELSQRDPLAISADELAGVMSPRWIARGCGPCEWYVTSSCEPAALLRYSARSRIEKPEPGSSKCTPENAKDPSCLGWVAIAGGHCRTELVEPYAVATARDRVAVLDGGRRELLIFSSTGDRLIAAIPTHARGPIVFTHDAIVVADDDELWAYDLTTLARRYLVNAAGPIARLAFAAGSIWVAVAVGSGSLHVYRLDEHDTLQIAKLADLQPHARDTGLASATDESACIEIPRGGGAPRLECIDRCGHPSTDPVPNGAPSRHREGTIATISPLDSGMPRCHWHRVRIDLELPERTAIAVELATVEDPSEIPGDADWQRVDAATASKDFLVNQPPGRYLLLRIQLFGDGVATPKIQRIRIDFPRSTSAVRLPGVFREDPITADFLDRFIATFDASIEDLDRIIARFPALLDPSTTPATALAWIGAFFDVALDPAWSEQARRNILSAAPELYARRGTPWALAKAVELVTGTAPAIQELGATLPFARLASPGAMRGFRVGEARLFGRSRARLRLGTSAIGAAPLRSYGDPDRDHAMANGWRIVVQVPGGDYRRTADAIERLRRLVEMQKPAHVTATVRVGSDLALLGIESAVGIDTRLGGLPLPYLGHNVRLRRASALARGSARGGASFAVGIASAVSVQTVLS